MQFTIKGSHILAVLITAGIGFWMLDGEIEIGGQSDAAKTLETNKETISSEETEAAALFKVNVVTIDAIKRTQSISVRGRTKADAIIAIRAETNGVLEKRLFSRGDAVKAGDLVCVIQQGARKMALASAQARLDQAQANYTSSEKLKKKGFATATAMRRYRFELDAAKAQLEQNEIELERTEVKANATGIVQNPIAEVGDVMMAGDTCLTLMDSDPMFFTGQVSERAISSVQVGMNADIALVTGEKVTGTVSYVGQSAEPKTRTFPLEIKLNSEKPIRDGLTATAAIKLPPEKAIRILPSWLSLADNGEVGVKIVDGDSRVSFIPVNILSQTNKGFWVSGLEPGDRVITLGQEYVISGEIVDPIPAPFNQAQAGQ